MLTDEEKREKARIRAKEWYYRNREKGIENAKKWANNNKERRKEIQKKSDRKHAESLSATRKKWWENNPHKRDEYAAKTDKDFKQRCLLEWREKNPEKLRLIRATYRSKNVEKIRERSRIYSKKNPEVAIRGQATRRARKLGNGGQLSKGIRKLLWQEQSGKCSFCLEVLDAKKTHLDHFVPLSLGGLNCDENVVLACASCNTKKGCLHPIEFMRRIKIMPAYYPSSGVTVTQG